MTKRNAIVALLCLAAAACGKDSSGNAAAARQFTYGAPSPASSTQAAALQNSLSGVSSFQTAPSASAAASFTEFSHVTDTLVGSNSFSLGVAGALAQRNALTMATSAALYSPTDYGMQFDNPACVTVTSASVHLGGCKMTVPPQTSGGETINATVTADGSVTLDSPTQTLTWDLTVAVTVTISGSSGSGSGTGVFHGAGKLTVVAPTATADGTIKGNMTSEFSLSASGGGQSASLRVDESLVIDVTYQTAPTDCVTGGTLEAKRVFADWSVPNVAKPADKGALITWTSCGNGTIAFSTN